MFFNTPVKKTTATILADLTAKVEELFTLAEEERAVVVQKQVEIDNLVKDQVMAKAEADKAESIADKINALIS